MDVSVTDVLPRSEMVSSRHGQLKWLTIRTPDVAAKECAVPFFWNGGA
jgi:hypothetical protein